MRGGWVAGLIELCVYLCGFVATGRWVVRTSEPGESDVLLTALCAALLWPLGAVLLGGIKVLELLFGPRPR